MGSTDPLNQTSSAPAEQRQPDKPSDERPPAAVVYSRDFAYEDNGPIVVLPTRMAAADVANASARTFAEYVVTSFSRLSVQDQGQEQEEDTG